MYTCKITLHEPRRTETETTHLTSFSLPSLQEVMQAVNTVMIVADRKKMLDSYSLTIHISKDLS